VGVGGAQQQLEAAHEVAGPARPGHAVGQAPYLAVGDGPRRIDGQADQVLHRAGDRGQRPLPVGQTASGEEDGVGSPPGELGGQPRLASSRLGGHHQEVRATLMQRRGQRPLERLQLGFPVDEAAGDRRGRPPRRHGRADLDGLEGHHRPRLALRPVAAAWPVPHGVLGPSLGLLGDQHHPRRGEIGLPGGHVHWVADEGEPARLARGGDHDLARVDAGVDVGEADAATTPRQRAGMVADGERGPDGSLGVVLVRGGDAEHRHEPVAQHVRDGPAVLLDDPPHGVQARADERVDLLGVQRGRQRGEA
jgi:hypothetical protein